MDNLHFILNNILTNFFKELTKYKNDYQQHLNYIYIYILELYYASYYIFLSISIHMYGLQANIYKIETSGTLTVFHVSTVFK